MDVSWCAILVWGLAALLAFLVWKLIIFGIWKLEKWLFARSVQQFFHKDEDARENSGGNGDRLCG